MPFAALIIALLSAQADDRPSFDCARASTPVEHAICAEPGLARLDMRMAARYAAVRRAMPPGARSVLTTDQRWFLGARDEWFENRDRWEGFPDLTTRMTGRIAFLDSLDTRVRPGLTGRWVNVAGVAEVADAGDGRLRLSIAAASPVNARWICEVSGMGRVSDGVLTVTAEDSPGWRLRVTSTGGVLRIEELGPGGDAIRPYCGNNGHVDGGYFRTRAS